VRTRSWKSFGAAAADAKRWPHRADTNTGGLTGVAPDGRWCHHVAAAGDPDYAFSSTSYQEIPPHQIE
jgi:hypothetical protein